MKLLLSRALMVCGCIAIIVMMSACAGSQVIEHGVDIEVRGTEPIWDVQVLYGSRVIEFKGKRPLGSGGGWNAPMPIPDAMTISWIVKENKKIEVVSLKNKYSLQDRLVKWKLVFKDDALEVFRIDDDASSRFNLKKPIQVYP